MYQGEEEKNPKDNDGVTPLHWAARHGHLAICQYIFERVQDKNPKGNIGGTPLHLAAENGHLAICQYIIERVQDKNPKTKTPLYLATNFGYKELADYLKSML